MSTVPQGTGVRDIAKKCFELAYKDIAPANITLGLLIIILNCLVIAYYRRNISKLTPALFVCIACCDISAAVGNIVFGVGVLLWFHGPKSSAEATMWWCYVTYRAVGLLGYAASIFFNTLLAVSRTVFICNPFYQLNFVVMKALAGGFLTFLVALTIFDVYFLVDITPEMNFTQVIVFFFFVVSLMASSTFPGQAIAWHVYIGSHLNAAPTAAVEFTLLSLIYLLPVLAVFVSMLVQVIVVVRRSRARSDDGEGGGHFDDWSHINTTVFLLASLFLVCNAALTIDTFIVQLVYHGPDFNPAEYRVFGIVQTVLPLLNSLLSPVIIVSRNARIKQDLLNKVRAVVRHAG